MDRPIRGVTALPLVDGVGITLVRDDEGWRFSKWHRSDLAVAPLPPPPSEADRERYFGTPDAAVAYFKHHYVVKLPAV